MSEIDEAREKLGQVCGHAAAGYIERLCRAILSARPPTPEAERPAEKCPHLAVTDGICRWCGADTNGSGSAPRESFECATCGAKASGLAKCPICHTVEGRADCADCGCELRGIWCDNCEKPQPHAAKSDPSTSAPRNAGRGKDAEVCARCGSDFPSVDHHCGTCYREMETRAALHDPRHSDKERVCREAMDRRGIYSDAGLRVPAISKSEKTAAHQPESSGGGEGDSDESQPATGDGTALGMLADAAEEFYAVNPGRRPKPTDHPFPSVQAINERLAGSASQLSGHTPGCKSFDGISPCSCGFTRPEGSLPAIDLDSIPELIRTLLALAKSAHASEQRAIRAERRCAELDRDWCESSIEWEREVEELKEKLAAAETSLRRILEDDEPGLSLETLIERVELDVNCEWERAENAEAERDGLRAKVEAWEPVVEAAIEQTESNFFFEGSRIRHCSEKFWPAVKAIPAEHRPEAKP